MYPSPVEREVAHEEEKLERISGEKLERTSERKRVETLGKVVGKAQYSVGSRVDG